MKNVKKQQLVNIKSSTCIPSASKYLEMFSCIQALELQGGSYRGGGGGGGGGSLARFTDEKK